MSFWVEVFEMVNIIHIYTLAPFFQMVVNLLTHPLVRQLVYQVFCTRYFWQIYLKEKSLQFHKLQPHRKLPLLYPVGWYFSYTTEFPCCKGMIFLRVGLCWNILFLIVSDVARIWWNYLIVFCLLRNKSVLYRLS